MAKRSKNTQWGQRDILTQIASPRLLLPPIRLETLVSPMVEDRRTYNPLGEFRPPLTIGGGRTSIVPATPAKKAASNIIPSGVAFSEPSTVNICRRRQARRQVLAAKKLFKKGSGAASRRRNIWSDVSC